jgi:hypothetical protein
VVGNGHSRHLAPRGLVHHLFEVAGPIEQTVVRVQMQVNESRIFHAERYSNLTREFLLRRRKAFPVASEEIYFSREI